MSRAPYQVLVIPYLVSLNEPLFAVLKREPGTGGYWQFVAGGGEGSETPIEAARREAWEEAGVPPTQPMIELSTVTSIPVVNFGGFLWGPDVVTIPEYCFGVECDDDHLVLSSEHTAHRWVTYAEASRLVRWDSNRTALWELNWEISGRTPDVDSGHSVSIKPPA